MSKKNILFISGIPDDNTIEILAIKKDAQLLWKGSGDANISHILKNDLFEKTKIKLDTNKRQEFSIGKVDAVFNQISDADTHILTLAKAEEIYQKLPTKVPFFNTPADIRKTTRDTIYKLLQGIDNLHVPKTVKIQPMSPMDIHETIKKENLVYPVIFRQAGDHGGISTIRIEDETESFYTFALDGRNYYLTQFVEYIKEGIYAKYRLVVIDGEVFLRHAIFGTEWMVHARNETEENIQYHIDASKRFLKEIKPIIQPIVTKIHQRLGLDYFGIDCAIDDKMNLLAFEINANMNIFIEIENSVFDEHINLMYQALIKMLEQGVKEK